MSWKLDLCKLSNLISLVVVIFWTSINQLVNYWTCSSLHCAETLVLVMYKTFDTFKFTAPSLRLFCQCHWKQKLCFFLLTRPSSYKSECFVHTCSVNLMPSQLGQSELVRSNPFHLYEFAILVKLSPFLSIIMVNSFYCSSPNMDNLVSPNLARS